LYTYNINLLVTNVTYDFFIEFGLTGVFPEIPGQNNPAKIEYLPASYPFLSNIQFWKG